MKINQKLLGELEKIDNETILNAFNESENITECYRKLFGIENKKLYSIDEWWSIKTAKWAAETSVKWVFAAWDVKDKNTPFRQAVVAAWSWCKAALEAEQFLKTK